MDEYENLNPKNKDSESMGNNLLDNIINNYPYGVESIFDKSGPRDTDSYVILIFNGTKRFHEKFINFSKRKPSEIKIELDPETVDNFNEKNKEGNQNIFQDEKEIDTYLKYYKNNDTKHLFMEHLEKNIIQTHSIIKLLQETFYELNKAEDKLIEKVIFYYGQKKSDEDQKRNISYYNICDSNKYQILRKLKNLKENKEMNSLSLLEDFYFELYFEDFILLFASLIHYYTGIDIKLELLNDKAYHVLMLLYCQNEGNFDSLADYFGYELQLKPYAYKYNEILQEKKIKLINKLTNTQNKLFNLNLNQPEQSSASVSLAGSASKKKLDRENYKEFLKNINTDEALHFPPYRPFEDHKENKFYRYYTNDKSHICPDDPDFFENQGNYYGTCAIGECSKFRSIDKFRLIRLGLEQILNFHPLKQKKILLTSLNKRSESVYENNIKLWELFSNLLSFEEYTKTVTVMRNFYGESVSYYFLWLFFLSSWVLLPAMIGVVVFVVIYNPPENVKNLIEKTMKEKTEVILSFKLDYYDISLILFCFIITIWATFFLKTWKQKEAMFSYIWGTEKIITKEEINENFVPDKEELFIIGEKISTTKRSKAILKQNLTFNIILFIIILRICFDFFIKFYSINFIQKSTYTRNKDLIVTSILQAVVIKLFSYLNSFVSEKLSSWENHETKEELRNSFAWKLITLEFFNNYTTLLFIAFYKPYSSVGGKTIYCYKYNCLTELEKTLYIFICCDFVFTILEIVWSTFVYKYKLTNTDLDISNSKQFKGKRLSKIELLKERLMLSSIEHQLLCSPKNNIIIEFNKKMVRFGYVCLFSVAAPLTPLLVLILNLLDTYLDLYKLFNLYRVEIIEKAKGIGVYNSIIKGLYYIGMMVNVSVFLFTSPKLRHLSLYLRKHITQNDDFIIKILIFSLFENAVLLINLISVNVLPLWYSHVSEIKSLYDKKYYSRETCLLPNIKS